MDKKSIIGIAVVAVLFLGFAYFNSQQQKEYLEQKAAIFTMSETTCRLAQTQRAVILCRTSLCACKRRCLQ